MTTTKVFDCISMITGEVVTLSVPVGYELPQVMELAGIIDPCIIRRVWQFRTGGRGTRRPA